MFEEFRPEIIQDVAGARRAVVGLLNIVEELKQENIGQREEIQRLRDEINRLKAEQGKPKIKGNKKGSDHFGPHSDSGRRAWGVFMTVAETANTFLTASLTPMPYLLSLTSFALASTLPPLNLLCPCFLGSYAEAN